MATIKLKEPPHDDNDIQNSLHHQETGNINMEIKQEPELMLESEFTWLPTKLEDEQQEYYQQYWHNDSEDEQGIKLILPPIKPDKMDDEEYTIEDNREFLSDNEDGDDAVKGNGDDNDVSNTKITKNTDLDDNIVASGSVSTNCQILTPIKPFKSNDTIEDNREFLSDNDDDGDDDEGNVNKDDVSYKEDDSDNEDDSNDEEDYSNGVDSDDYYMDDGVDVSYTEITKNMDLDDNNAASSSGTIKPTNPQQEMFSKWLRVNYMHYVCPICKDKFESETKRKTHINKQHANLIESTKSSYYFINKTRIICKQCRKNIRYKSLLMHSLKHTEKDNLELYLCNICNFKYIHINSLQKHIIKEHPNVQELFENLKVQPELHKCPICPAIYTDKNCLRFHFKDNHQNEYRELFRYPCHLCKRRRPKFDNLQDFLKHLLEEHNLKDLKLMNFKLFTTDRDGEQIYCTKCFNLFTDIDLIKFARHYLEHERQSYKNCKACSRKFSLKHYQQLHMCPTLRDKYKLQAEKTIKNVLAVPSRNQKKELPSWKEFEEYIKHICPFCNTEFEDLQNWQKHLRHTHHLDTLKGLRMKQISEDSHKLQCNVCQTLVNNKSVELHTHCFQHLNFKPYICRHCSQTLKNYKLAINHVLNKCQNLNEQNKSNALIDLYEIICPLCKKKLPKSEALTKHYANAHDNFLNYYTQQKDDTSLICNICQLEMENEMKLYRSHILQHFEQKSHRCIICTKTYNCRNYGKHIKCHFAVPINKATKKNITEDSQLQTFSFAKTPKAPPPSAVLNEFSDYILFACPECNENVSNQQLWWKHITEKHDFFQEHNLCFKDPRDGSLKCKHCNMISNNKVNYRQKHKLLHMPYKAFICGICYHRSTSLGDLYSHLRRQHFNKGLYDCVMCSEVLTTQYAKAEHIKTAHPKSEWPANMCLTCFKTVNIYKMKLHLLTHDLNRPKFECKYCGAKLVFEKDFKNHIARHEKMLETDTSKETIEIHTIEKYTPKGVINKDEEDGLNSSQLQTFSFAETPKAFPSAVLNEFSDYILFACPECNENVSNKELWWKHITENHDFFQEHNLCFKDPQDGSLKCKHCKIISYNSVKDRQKHKLVHMPYKAFICGVCYHRCTTLGVLYDHLRRIHFNKGSYNCVMCSEVLTTQYAKAEHIKTAHPKSEWPKNMCLTCFKTVNIYKMKAHLLTHDLSRPKFECKYCGAKLVLEKDLKIHTARHEKMLETDTSKETIEIYTFEKSTPKGVKQDNAFTQTAADDNLTKKKSNKRIINPQKKLKKETIEIDKIKKFTPDGVKQNNVSTQAAADVNLPKEKSNKRNSNSKTTNQKKKTKKETIQIDTIEKSAANDSTEAAAGDDLPKKSPIIENQI